MEQAKTYYSVEEFHRDGMVRHWANFASLTAARRCVLRWRKDGAKGRITITKATTYYEEVA